jgi:hypothetical protein
MSLLQIKLLNQFSFFFCLLYFLPNGLIQIDSLQKLDDSESQSSSTSTIIEVFFCLFNQKIVNIF